MEDKLRSGFPDYPSTTTTAPGENDPSKGIYISVGVPVVLILVIIAFLLFCFFSKRSPTRSDFGRRYSQTIRRTLSNSFTMGGQFSQHPAAPTTRQPYVIFDNPSSPQAAVPVVKNLPVSHGGAMRPVLPPLPSARFEHLADNYSRNINIYF